MINLNIIRNFSGAKLYHCYTTLKINPNASRSEIREKFLRLSRIYHPDNKETGSHNKFVRLKNAYEIIKDAPLRSGQKYPDQSEYEQDLSYQRYISALNSKKEYVYVNPKDEYTALYSKMPRKKKFFFF